MIEIFYKYRENIKLYKTMKLLCFFKFEKI